MSNPYEVERTVQRFGQANTSAEIPDDLIITLVHLAGTDYFELFVNSDQIGAVHRNDDFVGLAAKHLAKESK